MLLVLQELKVVKEAKVVGAVKVQQDMLDLRVLKVTKAHKDL
jgi:hypothetical protein